jgi:hypothetical protein
MTDSELNTPNHLQNAVHSGVDMLIGPARTEASTAQSLPRGSTSSCLGAKHSPYLIDRATGVMYMKRRGWEG